MAWDEFTLQEYHNVRNGCYVLSALEARSGRCTHFLAQEVTAELLFILINAALLFGLFGEHSYHRLFKVPLRT